MKKLLSYLFPIKLNSYETLYNGTLYVNLLDGRKILDTTVSNYSYGPLQKVLYKGLQALPFHPATKNVLVLGMGAGSIVETIRRDFNSDARIVLVEIDPMVIAIAEQEFSLGQYSNIQIIAGDAIELMRSNSNQFDLVIVDLFIIDTIPVACTEATFLQQLANAIAPGGQLLYNTFNDTLAAGALNNMVDVLLSARIDVRQLSNVEGANDLLLGKK